MIFPYPGNLSVESKHADTGASWNVGEGDENSKLSLRRTAWLTSIRFTGRSNPDVRSALLCMCAAFSYGGWGLYLLDNLFREQPSRSRSDANYSNHAPIWQVVKTVGPRCDYHVLIGHISNRSDKGRAASRVGSVVPVFLSLHHLHTPV